MKRKLVALLGIAMIGSATATVTLQFNAAGFTGEGGELSGVTWGVIVDAAGDGLDNLGAIEGGWSLTNNALVGTSDDDFFFLGASATPGGGFVTQAAGVTDAPGNDFALIWFETSLSAGEATAPGLLYGTYTQANFVMPAAGSVTSFAPVAPGGNVDTAFTGIPEPSVALLGALGVLGLIRRRR
ncbi:hypothetical protein [Haloferula rosea]|uniref:PEP-CTERM protein-sorting domain-containing protein n=1 Tax=Haloferula rosea TaxID=490093 RepID=A0A934RGJ3_9BACT|nr:hypothetical protein [Haloferula rosea]MBK1828126.1 hypothetical protein [Haloferula rosea]